MRITIAVHGQDVDVWLTPTVQPTGTGRPQSYAFTWKAPDTLTAAIVASHLRKDLYSLVESIRKQAYNMGWADKASHKRRKKRDFWRDLELTRTCGY